MDLSTAAWFYLFSDEMLADPRCGPRPGVRGVVLGAVLHRLSLEEHVGLRVVTRRGGPLWLQQVPTLRVGRKYDRRLSGFEARLVEQLHAGPLRGHSLFYRLMEQEERDRRTMLGVVVDELEAAGLGARDRRHPSLDWLRVDERRKAAVAAEFAPRGEEWLAFCADLPGFAEALGRDLRYADAAREG